MSSHSSVSITCCVFESAFLFSAHEKVFASPLLTSCAVLFFPLLDMGSMFCFGLLFQLVTRRYLDGRSLLPLRQCSKSHPRHRRVHTSTHTNTAEYNSLTYRMLRREASSLPPTDLCGASSGQWNWLWSMQISIPEKEGLGEEEGISHPEEERLGLFCTTAWG